MLLLGTCVVILAGFNRFFLKAENRRRSGRFCPLRYTLQVIDLAIFDCVLVHKR